MSLASDLFNGKPEDEGFTIIGLDYDGDIEIEIKNSKGKIVKVYFPSLEDIEQMKRICEKLLEEK